MVMELMTKVNTLATNVVPPTRIDLSHLQTKADAKAALAQQQTLVQETSSAMQKNFATLEANMKAHVDAQIKTLYQQVQTPSQVRFMEPPARFTLMPPTPAYSQYI